MNIDCKYSISEINTIAEIEHNLHPLANLRDFYKLFFQAYWAQGHFIPDADATESFLQQELTMFDKPYLPLLQDISHHHGLYRVSISAINQNKLTFDDFLKLFLDNRAEPVNWSYWAICWQDIQSLLLSNYPHLNDSNEIELCAEVITKQAIISHSECFRLTYNPHYRVMQLSEDICDKIQ